MQTTAMNYRTIVLRPDRFQEILLDKVLSTSLLYCHAIV